jgi:hypothetical protein
MKKYRIVLDFISSRTDVPYFRIECSTDNGSSWSRIGGNAVWTAPNAHELVRQIIEGEGEYIVVPVTVEKIRFRS